MQMRYAYTRWLLGAFALSVPLSGCHVDSRKDASHDDVKIATPFGGMSVKTNDAAVQANVGLALYPGATLVEKTGSNGKSHDDSAADINMSFGSFHLGVKAVSYQTPDPVDKVIAFYRKDMARYGQVLFCQGHRAVGSPTVTQDGLTCSEQGHKNVQVNEGDDGAYGELKAGSELHQHVVSLDQQGGGTRFGLVMLDLPGHLGIGDDSDSRQ